MDDIVKQLDETEKKNLFELVFFLELDSWFSTDFFLCDNCIEDFIDNWKGFEILCFESLETNAIDVDSFYSGTRLCDMFSPNEFRKFLNIIECPYCSTPIKYNMWPRPVYFDLQKYRADICEISKLTSSTPSLISSNSFSMSIFELVKEIAGTCTYELIDTDLYRARITGKPDCLLEDSEIGVVPDSLAKEGRFNHSGHGHLYVATTEKLCLKEIGAYKNKSACVAKIKLLKPLKILDLTDYDGTKYDNDLYKTIVSSSLIYNTPSDDSWDRPEYVFTRFVADCAMHAGFDAIKYKSRYDFKGLNYVILRNKVNKDFSWNSVYQITNKTLYSKTY